MTRETSAEYYTAREQQERNLAVDAEDPAVAAVHSEMAGLYAQLLSLEDRNEVSNGVLATTGQ